MSDKTVLLERQGRVAIFILNRPERANALNAELRADLQAAALEVANDLTVRAVIVTGAGRHFCGGADLRAGRNRRASLPGPGVSLEWLPQPVIAAINGACMGGGCELSLTCDFRFIAADAKIGLPEINFGGLPGGGGTARAPRLIGLANAKRLIMSGQPLDAYEAHRVGLVDEVYDSERLMEAALAFANVLAAKAPYATRTAKTLLNRTLEIDLAAALELEKLLLRQMASPEERQQARDEAAATSATYARIFSRPDAGGVAGH